MDGSKLGKFKTTAAAAALCLLASTIGCGVEPQEGDGVDTVTGEAKNADLLIVCPTFATVEWIQAANGRTNKILVPTDAVIWRDQPYDKIGCHFPYDRPAPLVQQIVQFKPGTVESQCGAKATVTAQATTSGAVPPFGGFVFKTQRLQAMASYDKTTGICLLTLPITNDIRTNFFPLIKVSEKCKTVGDTAYKCPPNTYPM